VFTVSVVVFGAGFFAGAFLATDFFADALAMPSRVVVLTVSVDPTFDSNGAFSSPA